MMPQKTTYSKEVIAKEIGEISEIATNELKEEVKEKAAKIAFAYIAENKNVDPVTLARASFYIALKEYQCFSEKSVKRLINNNGKENRWWLYVFPLVERHMKRR